MSQTFGTENFLEDADTISVFFFRNKFRNFDYLFYLFRSTDLSGTLQSVIQSVANQKQ